MKHLRRLIILIVLQVLPLTGFASGDLENTCPVSYELSMAEKDNLKEFELRLRQANNQLGRDGFERKLQEVLSRLHPEKRVIDVSPFFMELALYHIDVKYLQDAVEKTIGLQHETWVIFEREVHRVLRLGKGGSDSDQRRFAKATEKLMKGIEGLNPYASRHFGQYDYTAEEAGLQKSRAVAQIANMYTTIERVRYINNEIRRQRREAFKAGLALNSIRIASAAVVIAATIYAGPIIAIAGTVARAYVADAVVATHLARIGGQAVAARAGQAGAGAGLGLIGAPAGRLALDTHSAIGLANTASLNNRTSLACELDRQFENWKERGIDPYLDVALTGGSLGLALTGGIHMIPRVGRQVVLSLTSFGVGVTQLYTLGLLGQNTLLSLHHYDLAEIANRKGDKEAAVEHLHRAREYAQMGGEQGLESILLGVLSASIGASFRTALIEGRDAIAVVLANSADTLPLSMTVGAEMIK